MRRAFVGIALGLAGFGIGFASERWTVSPNTMTSAGPSTTASAPHEARRASPSPPSAPRARRSEPAPELQRENAELREEIELVREQLVAITGEPLPWPKDLPHNLGPQRMQERFEAAVHDFEDASMELDCAEYPCVLLVEATNRDAADTAFREFQSDEFGGATHSVRSSMGITTDGELYFRRAHTFFHEDEVDPAALHRIDYRTKTLLESMGPNQ